MFTLEQIAATHAKVKTGADFPRYVQDLKALGMDYYDFFVADGHSEYVSTTGERLLSPVKYPAKAVNNTADAPALRHTIEIHQQGQTDFMTFCEQAANAGVRYWRTDVTGLRCVYVDELGNDMLVEPIPDASGY